MQNIYALIIGINGYPEKPLNGCIADAVSVKNYLEDFYGKDGNSKLVIKTLFDANPDNTAVKDEDKPFRQNIINAFDFYEKAKGNDVCFFYYAGHGSSFDEAPPEFRDSSGSVQSFVCLDSLNPDGKDLMDKEISYLIWKTMINKPDVNFVAVTDCCHSGTITRDVLDESGIAERKIPGAAERVPQKVEDYLGFGISVLNKATNQKEKAFEEVNVRGKRFIDVKIGKHIHIAASRDSQTAKEPKIDGVKRGAFTHSLLKTLNIAGGNINYKDLIDQTSALVKNRVRDQEPDVNIMGGLSDLEKEKIFLSQESAISNPTYLIYNDSNYVDRDTRDTTKSWCIKGGTIHGISKGDKVIIDGGRFTTVVMGSPEPDISLLKFTDEFGQDTEKNYRATVERQPNQELKISFHPKIDPKIKKLIQDTQVPTTSLFVSLLAEGPGQYIVNSDKRGTFITLPGSEDPVFSPIKVTDSATAKLFIENLEIVGKWVHLFEFNNPSSDLTGRYSVKLYKSVLPGNYDPDTFEEVKEIKPLNDLSYNNGKQPAFRLSITNTSGFPLWITNAYMAFDYSISTDFFEPLEIADGGEKRLTFVKNGKTTDIIKLSIEKKFQNLGYKKIEEYIKLFISTKKIDTAKLKQPGIDLEPVQTRGEISTRAVGGDDEDEEVEFGTNNSWKTETIGFRIIMP